MKIIKNIQSSQEASTQSTNNQAIKDPRIRHVFDKSTLKYKKSDDVERFWSHLNQDSKITSKTRDQRKIFSITSFVIEKARVLGIPAQKIRDIYFQRYRNPLTYLNALRNYIPELENDLALLCRSEQIDSRFRSCLKIEKRHF